MAKTPANFRIPELILRILFTRRLKEQRCSHLDLISYREPTADVCQDCVDLGDTWPNLRMCLVCSYVSCGDTPKNKHMQ